MLIRVKPGKGRRSDYGRGLTHTYFFAVPSWGLVKIGGSNTCEERGRALSREHRGECLRLFPGPEEWDLVPLGTLLGNKQEWLHRQKFDAYKAYGEWFYYLPPIGIFLIGEGSRDLPPVPHWTTVHGRRIERE
jgi:hypothetical protein